MIEPTFTKEQLEEIAAIRCDDASRLAAYALVQVEAREKVENRVKVWGCPNDDRVCLNCGRPDPCMTEADLKPGDPGIPCQFDMTYQEMISRLHQLEDSLRVLVRHAEHLRYCDFAGSSIEFRCEECCAADTYISNIHY